MNADPIIRSILLIHVNKKGDVMADLRDLIPEQEPVTVAEGFQFTEGPVWHPEGWLLFSDIPANTIYRYIAGGRPEPYLTPSRHANGLTFDRQGRLLACEHGGRQVSRMAADGKMQPRVGHYAGRRLNSPNDLVVHSGGSIFFTDPPYGIDPEPGEQGFNGVYRLDPDGNIALLNSTMNRPNGLAFSLDESVLYVADSRSRNVLSFPVNADLSLGEPSVLVAMDTAEPGGPDGMKLDRQGNVYVAGPGGLWVITPAGESLGTIALPQLPANLCFGGPDYRTLYITARTALYSLAVNVAGLPVF